MEVSAIAMQQAQAQTNATLSMVKKNAQADQALVNMIANSSLGPSSRGNNLDISV